ncbi:hypothetical protein GCM10010530_12400 [Kribbella aluminosa]
MTLSPLSSFSVIAVSLPPVLVTVTGLSGCTDVAPLAGTTAMLAAGLFDGVVDVPGVLEAPGVLLCDVEAPGVDCPPLPLAFVSPHAVPASSRTQIPATARPYFLTEPFTIPQLSPV